MTDIIQRTIDKMTRSQQNKEKVVAYLKEYKPHLLGSLWKEGRIKECCNVLRFHSYLN